MKKVLLVSSLVLFFVLTGTTIERKELTLTPALAIETEATIGKKNALRKAKQYLEYTAFSRDELIAQLEYDGFTHQQAEYGAQAVGY